MSDPTSALPARPSLEQLRKQAKELLRRARDGDSDAVSRLGLAIGRRAGGEATPFRVADAQLALAREYGFRSWPKLVHHVEAIARSAPALARPMIRPVELRGTRAVALADGTSVSAETVWSIFVAAREGDIARVKALVASAPALALVEYNYTPPLHFAVREGHLELVELLLDRGADLAYRSYPFQDSLLEMAEDREHAEIAALLRRRLSRRFALGTDPRRIIEAARDGDVAGVRSELARDATLARASNETGDTALHHAAHRGHLEIVNLLLDAGADADAVRGDGYRPIHCALMPHWQARVPRERGAVIADRLLAHGARSTIFIEALRGEQRAVRDALRRDRSLANFEDSCRHRPISAAARRNDVATARLLLEHGADPNLPEEGAPRGQALWLAVHARHREMARLLVEHGADPNAVVESSGTPMDAAKTDPELRELLRAHGGTEPTSERDLLGARIGALVGERDYGAVERLLRAHPELLHDELASWGDGILAGPAREGDHELLALLIGLGARVPPVSKWAPYYYFKHEKTAAFLLDHGMDPNHMNWHRLTLLHHMAAEGELAKARLLVDHGADIDAVDEEYRSTPLGLAARRGQRAVVTFLLERGADPDLAAAPWASPLAWARKKGHDEIASLLREAGASG